MVAKLRIALVLLIIGSVSGLAIVGVNSFTAPIIEENRARAQYEDYLEMFPDLADVDEEDIEDHDVLDRRFVIKNSDGDEIGTIYRGQDTNEFGDVTVLVGISGTEIVQVIISNHSNTPNYANIIIENHLEPFSGQSIEDVSYDSSTGATATYGSVEKIVDAAVLMAQGADPGDEPEDHELEAYRSVLENAADYEDYLDYGSFAFKEEISIMNSGGGIIAHGFTVGTDDGDVVLLFAPDTTFLGAVYPDEDAPASIEGLISDMEAFAGETVRDIDPDNVPADLEEAFKDLADFIPDYERVLGARVKEEEQLDDTDTLIGFRYIALKDGFSGTANEFAIEVDLDGEVTDVSIIEHYDTADGYVDDIVVPNLGHYDGYTLDDMSDAEGDDAFAGATGTGNSVVEAITAALELHGRRADYNEIFSETTTLERTYLQGYDALYRRIDVYDAQGDMLGVIYEGEDRNNFGDVRVLVGIADGAIEGVTIPYHTNTEEYADTIIDDHLDPFAGQPVDDVDYDAQTGATSTYESVQKIIEEALDAENERTGE